jgi:hydrogenase nickel incorporation protein HypA/HybF
MHEMSIAQQILEIVEQHLPEPVEGRVTAIKLRIGEMAGIVAESLEFCFSAIAEGTLLEGAALVIEQCPIVVRCKDCEAESRLDFMIFSCPSCGSRNVRMISGNELHVIELELENGREEEQ